MKRRKVAILFGGCSTEYEVSIESAYSIIKNMDPVKYKAILIGITRQGAWRRYYGSPEKIKEDTWIYDSRCVPTTISPNRSVHGLIELSGDKAVTTRIDLAFPVLHGKNGEDGTVQGLLEMAGIPFVGCGVLSSAMCMDKDIAHKVVGAAGIKVPRYVVLRPGCKKTDLIEKIGNLKLPLFVKPANAGSSVGITRVTQKEELDDAVTEAFKYDCKIVVEEGIDGFEVGCAVLGNDEITIGKVDEIELSHGILDYTDKYTHRTSTIHMPARIDVNTAQRIKQTAAAIYRVLMCSGFARVDMFLTPAGDVVFNEVNTIPGLTEQSRFPSMLRGAGISLKQMIDTVIDLGAER